MTSLGLTVAPLPLASTGPPVEAAATFVEIYQAHAGPVYGWLTRLVGPVAERDDLLQQTFLRVHLALPTFRGEASVTTFIRRIAINVAIDHLRARGRRPVDFDADALAALAAGGPSPADAAGHRQQLAQVFTLLAELPPDQRVAFVLIAIEGLSARAAAALVGVSPDAVKQRAVSARRTLTDRLARMPRSKP